MARLVPAVLRAADILELFLGDDVTLSASEIGSRLELPRSTTHELLTTLVERHYLVRRSGEDLSTGGPIVSGRESAARVTANLAPMCTTSAPMVTHATQ